MGNSRIMLSLASILSFRMLGLFMIYPIFALYAPEFSYANSTLIGIALGIYGLTQAILQLPLSMVSDRIGRKPVITGGLIIFALGSMLCALTHNIYLLIIGRALQGAGAIGSTLMACAADITSLGNRTKAMAILGMTIGISFALAMILGPLMNEWFHLSGIFWLTAILAFAGIIITFFFIPSRQKDFSYTSEESFLKTVKNLLRQKELINLNISILILHALFTASFVVIPLLFSQLEVSTTSQWKIYLPILIGAFFLTLPFLIFTEKKNLIKHSLLTGILMMGISEYLFYYFSATSIGLMIALFLFFTGFTLLEALLPSLISKNAPTYHKGSAMGLYSTFQFIGIFLGGSLGGILRSHYDNPIIFYCCMILCVLWFTYMLFIKSPATLKTRIISV